jgi:hypothetical protein
MASNTLIIIPDFYLHFHNGLCYGNGIDSGGTVGARANPRFGGSLKGQSLISTYLSLAIKASTSGFEKLSMVLYVCPVGCLSLVLLNLPKGIFPFPSNLR